MVMSGQDGIALMATGSGKTVCFTLPAVLSDKFTVVIIPTISLLKDMFSRLSRVCNAVMVNGELSKIEKENLYASMSKPDSQIKIILTTPEQLVNDKYFVSSLSNKCGRIIVDEAHCIDRWGNQFRPDYLRLNEARIKLNAQVVCFTGTATEKTQRCIIDVLHLTDPFIYKMSFNRSNLHFSVLKKLDFKDGLNKLLTYVSSADNASCIVYCQTPAECNKVCTFLMEKEMKCVPYHGEIDPIEKSVNQQQWQADEVNIIVATKSLGMGIDKANVKLVVHFSIPCSIDDYYQEAGRAGRDGSPSKCILLYKFEDRSIHINHISKISGAQDMADSLVELHNVIKYCFLTACRKAYILNHYGEDADETCCVEHCDICEKKTLYVSRDFSDHAVNVLLLLQGMSAINKYVSISLVASVYKGSKSKNVLKCRYDTLPLYGSGSEFSLKECSEFIMYMVYSGILSETFGKTSAQPYLTFGIKAGSILDRSGLVKRDILA